jgi:hypothetical protein
VSPIYGAQIKWELMQAVAARLATYDPAEVQWSISLALATRRAESIEAAKAIFLAASEKHPEEALIHYNLACYECQLGTFSRFGSPVGQWNLGPQLRSGSSSARLDQLCSASAL